jgi:hypothetical protein
VVVVPSQKVAGPAVIPDPLASKSGTWRIDEPGQAKARDANRRGKRARKGRPRQAAGAADKPAPESRPKEAPVADKRIPAGFKPGKRRGKVRGVVKYADERPEDRVDAVLIRLRREGKLQIEDEAIDILQRVANIETSGCIQGINTWDSAVVSIGFMQWTLEHGKLQNWIRRASGPFAKHGIELDWVNQYEWDGNKHTAIKGAPTKNELRWGEWAERFYAAGLDDDIILVEAQIAQEYLAKDHETLRRKLGNHKDKYPLFEKHYDVSAKVRGMFHSTMNNLPAVSVKAVEMVITRPDAAGIGLGEFLERYKDAIKDAYAEFGRRKAEKEGAEERKAQIRQSYESRGPSHTSKPLIGAQFDDGTRFDD